MNAKHAQNLPIAEPSPLRTPYASSVVLKEHEAQRARYARTSHLPSLLTPNGVSNPSPLMLNGVSNPSPLMLNDVSNPSPLMLNGVSNPSPLMLKGELKGV